MIAEGRCYERHDCFTGTAGTGKTNPDPQRKPTIAGVPCRRKCECRAAVLTIHNSIVAGNNNSDIHNLTAGRLSGSYNLIGNNGTGQTLLVNGVNGNIVGLTTTELNQLFVNAAQGNYRLAAGSLAVDKGSNALIPSGITTDRAGNARIVDGTVDIGAYEYQNVSYNAHDLAIADAAKKNNGLSEESLGWEIINGEMRLTSIWGGAHGALSLFGLTALKTLWLEGTQLTSLNVSGLTALTRLQVDNNQLTSLNISGTTALNWLSIRGNQSTTLTDAEVVTFTPSLAPPMTQGLPSSPQVRKGLEALGIKFPTKAK